MLLYHCVRISGPSDPPPRYNGGARHLRPEVLVDQLYRHTVSERGRVHGETLLPYPCVETSEEQVLAVRKPQEDERGMQPGIRHCRDARRIFEDDPFPDLRLLPGRSDEGGLRQAAEDNLGAPDLLYKACREGDVQAFRYAFKLCRGLASGLLLVSRPHHPLRRDSPLPGMPLCQRRLFRVEAVYVLEGDDLKADLPALHLERGIIEGKAELVHCPRYPFSAPIVRPRMMYLWKKRERMNGTTSPMTPPVIQRLKSMV